VQRSQLEEDKMAIVEGNWFGTMLRFGFVHSWMLLVEHKALSSQVY